jgi:shikimate dehydrogenase
MACTRAGYHLAAWNRTRANLEKTLAGLEADVEVLDYASISGEDGAVVNTTSASLAGGALPIDWSSAQPGALAFDLAYGSHELPFLSEAVHHGLKAIDGRSLLVEQGALAFEWWTGLEAPREDMMRAVQ